MYKTRLTVLACIWFAAASLGAQATQSYFVDEVAMKRMLGYWTSELRKPDPVQDGGLESPNPQVYFTISKDAEGQLYLDNFEGADFIVVRIAALGENEYELFLAPTDEDGNLLSDSSGQSLHILLKDGDRAELVDAGGGVFMAGSERLEMMRLSGPH
jgi:hypothetical protein